MNDPIAAIAPIRDEYQSALREENAADEALRALVMRRRRRRVNLVAITFAEERLRIARMARVAAELRLDSAKNAALDHHRLTTHRSIPWVSLTTERTVS